MSKKLKCKKIHSEWNNKILNKDRILICISKTLPHSLHLEKVFLDKMPQNSLNWESDSNISIYWVWLRVLSLRKRHLEAPIFKWEGGVPMCDISAPSLINC